MDIADLRPTFQEAYVKIIADSHLRKIACGDVLPLNNNWRTALDHDIDQVNNLVNQLCSDLSIATGRKIKRKSSLVVPDLNIGIKHLWESFLHRYTQHIRYVLSMLRPQYVTDITYPISAVHWQNETATFRFPVGSTVNNEKFRNAIVMTPHELELPKIANSKLYSLQNTHFNLQPQIIYSKDGQALVIRFGNYWNDYVISHWTIPYRHSWKNQYTQAAPWILVCFLVCFASTLIGHATLFPLDEACWWHYLLGALLFVAAAGSGSLGLFGISFLVSYKFTPLKV